MSSTIATPARTESIAWSRLLVAALIGIVGAAVANALIYVIASALGLIPADIEVQPGQTLSVAMVIISTIAGTLAGTIVFALLARFTRRPISLFRIIAGVALLLSFASPLTIPGAPLSMILTLELMHITAAAILVWALTTRSRKV